MILEILISISGVGFYVYYELKHMVCRGKANILHKNILDRHDS